MVGVRGSLVLRVRSSDCGFNPSARHLTLHTLPLPRQTLTTTLTLQIFYTDLNKLVSTLMDNNGVISTHIIISPQSFSCIRSLNRTKKLLSLHHNTHFTPLPHPLCLHCLSLGSKETRINTRLHVPHHWDFIWDSVSQRIT
jgi:hypothetical protein